MRFSAFLDATRTRRFRRTLQLRECLDERWLGLGSEDFRDFRCIVTRANRQPAVAGAAKYLPMALDVLELEGVAVRTIVTFDLSPLTTRFGLPAEL